MTASRHSHEKSPHSYDEHHAHGQHVTIEVPKQEEIDEGLAAIYGEERDDLSRLDKGGSWLTKILLRTVIVLACIAAVAFASFFVYLRFVHTTPVNPLTLTIDVPSEVVSGTTQTITIRYANTARLPLASLALDVNIPKAFEVTSMSPQPTDAEEYIWRVGGFEGNSDQAIVLEGTWIADVPSATTVQALATFHPSNFNSDFEQVATATVNTLSSNLVLTMAGPEEATPGQEVTYEMTLENAATFALAGATVGIALPNGFYVARTTPELEAGAPLAWDIAEIPADATQTLSFSGSFAADTSDVQQVAASVALTRDDLRLVQSETSVFTDVVGNGVSLQLVANGTAGNVTLDPGDPLRITVGYTNTGEAGVSGVSLLVDFQSDATMPITWSEATLDGGRLTADGIRFDATALGTLAPNEKQTKNLIFPVRSELRDGDAESWTVVLHATVGGVTIKSQPLTITLNSDASFHSAARYYGTEGEPLGDGPLPPQVHETTAYQILWSLGNSVHALEDIRISATVPPRVTWTNDVAASMGSVSYDDATRTVTWEITGIAANAGAATATFMLSVTPEDDDVGRFLKLLSGSSFRATDLTTGSTLQQTADSLTTECEGDPGVEGKGTAEE